MIMSRRTFMRQACHWAAGTAVAALGVSVAWIRSSAALLASNTFTLAQLKYRGGQWDPRPLATVSLMQEVRLRTSVESRDERQVLTLQNAALFSYPFLYMTGEQSFAPFSDEEIVILRRYLLFGGLLLIDDARGNKGQDFDASVRREIARLFPDRALKILPPDHTVFPSAACVWSIPIWKGCMWVTVPLCSTAKMVWALPGNAIIWATGCHFAGQEEKRNAWRRSSSASIACCTP
jgi:hypothetical protein